MTDDLTQLREWCESDLIASNTEFKEAKDNGHEERSKYFLDRCMAFDDVIKEIDRLIARRDKK